MKLQVAWLLGKWMEPNCVLVIAKRRNIPFMFNATQTGSHQYHISYIKFDHK
ncbi:predicted protein [Botrytis cinerea T4]|uniref:Uncharacterized protein n=1 Tax=Botryotinia fuckeliana (strain T4) TaxID=999810 RepID=G2XR39_BOTF4|nr:predicted protein [Botrytis cinerea T4]